MRGFNEPLEKNKKEKKILKVSAIATYKLCKKAAKSQLPLYKKKMDLTVEFHLEILEIHRFSVNFPSGDVSHGI